MTVHAAKHGNTDVSLNVPQAKWVIWQEKTATVNNQTSVTEWAAFNGRPNIQLVISEKCFEAINCIGADNQAYSNQKLHNKQMTYKNIHNTNKLATTKNKWTKNFDKRPHCLALLRMEWPLLPHTQQLMLLLIFLLWCMQ